ncbi:hypothetical protein FGADI_9185 [Fusarium gaditjirri]|uniref:L-glutamate gamma-semialdehyde dehydrogenase n=1 Tax=Fusarium gaditjirri TaxID=282569 RepID=A0A8H4WT08_9HYPO|nr:hypothetical protein FGADI_9185 [Fusarium gaditjirri]
MPEHVNAAKDAALKDKPSSEALPFGDRAAMFLRAAELVTGKYRPDIVAATRLGMGKNIWQAEIDAPAETADFFRADVKSAALNTVRAAFEYQGQNCSANSRVYIAESVWPEFKKHLQEQVSALSIGDIENYEELHLPKSLPNHQPASRNHDKRTFRSHPRHLHLHR